MAFNSTEIIQAIREEFEQMLEYVTNDAARQATADQMERGLFQRLLALGRQLLGLFFALRSQDSARAEYTTAEGLTLPYQRDTPRHYVSLFGKLTFWRPYFYQKGTGGAHPLDAELSLGADSYSDMVRELAEYLNVYGVYHRVTNLLARIFGLRLSSRAVQAWVLTDAADVLPYYEQKPVPETRTEAAVLVVQADGKGVPMIMEPDPAAPVRLGKGQKRGHKKEAIVTTAYTRAATPRMPEAVLRSYYDLAATTPESAPPPCAAPCHKHIWATLDGKDMALARLAQHVARRDGPHIAHRVMLCDGCEALQTRLTTYFPTYTQILDFIHANEYLWAAANALLGETDTQRLPWMIAHTRQLLNSETTAVITELRSAAADATLTTRQREQLEKTANYFERNQSYMDYATYLAHGWPIASGVIEGACRHFVKDRCELAGMRWSQTGAEHLLRLRAVAENDDWEAYHTFRRRERHQRLYSLLFPETPPLEWVGLAA